MIRQSVTTLTLAAFAIGVSIAPVTAHQDQMMQKDQSTMQRQTTTQQSSVLSDLDARFINDVHLGNQKEVTLANMALQKATSPTVKQYAQQMIDHHNQADSKVVQLAQMKGIKLPQGPSTSLNSVIDKMTALSGSSFDKAYIDEAVEDHKRAVDVYRMQAERGTDKDVQVLATQNLPEIESHLASARSISQQIASK